MAFVAQRGIPQLSTTKGRSCRLAAVSRNTTSSDHVLQARAQEMSGRSSRLGVGGAGRRWGAGRKPERVLTRFGSCVLHRRHTMPPLRCRSRRRDGRRLSPPLSQSPMQELQPPQPPSPLAVTVSASGTSRRPCGKGNLATVAAMVAGELRLRKSPPPRTSSHRTFAHEYPDLPARGGHEDCMCRDESLDDERSSSSAASPRPTGRFAWPPASATPARAPPGASAPPPRSVPCMSASCSSRAATGVTSSDTSHEEKRLKLKSVNSRPRFRTRRVGLQGRGD